MTLQRGKTKIICTLGPASSSDAMLVELIEAGAGILRLNFSHGTQEEHRAVLKNVRRAVERTGVEISVLQDLQGPKIRIGELGCRPSICGRAKSLSSRRSRWSGDRARLHDL